MKLDSQVKMLDCPGVIFEKDLSRNQLILQNTAKYGDELEEVVEAILERIPKTEIEEYYKIEPYSSLIDFLAKICRAHGEGRSARDEAGGQVGGRGLEPWQPPILHHPALQEERAQHEKDMKDVLMELEE